MAMNEAQKKIRSWFRRHKWSTNNTPTGYGFYLESPTESCSGTVAEAIDPETGRKRRYVLERYLAIEMDRFTCAYLTLSIYTRKHWLKRDPSVPDGTGFGFPWIHSDDFEPWPDRPAATFNIPARDVLKLAELVKAAGEDFGGRPGVSFMERIARGCGPDWIGVNTDYRSLAYAYSNERLRAERGWAGADEKPCEEEKE